MSNLPAGMDISFEFYQDGIWHEIDPSYVSETGLCADLPQGVFNASFAPVNEGVWDYTLSISSRMPSKLRMTLRAPASDDVFHLIPGCIFGNNNAERVKPEYPLLMEARPGQPFCSPVWEFRADRAAIPASILYGNGRVYGASIDPFVRDQDDSVVFSGVFAELPSAFGVTLGHTNRPCTFVDKKVPAKSTGSSACAAQVAGRIYCYEAPDRTGAHRIIREEYARRRDLPVYHRSLREAADGLFDAFVTVNWSAKSGEYGDCNCRPTDWLTLRPWREVIEIGWTGISELALSMLMYERLTPGFTPDRYCGAMTAAEMFDRICSRYNPDSGLLFDILKPNDQGSDVNGWWNGNVTHDSHCAYTVGKAVYALTAAADFLKGRGEGVPELWLETARKVVRTVCELQREDGAFGYAYAVDHREVLDWDGFAGCWFATASALLYRMTGEDYWLEHTLKALRYYGKSVRALNCWGTPMDTWKAVDEEGNLGFIRACRVLYEATRSEEALELFRLGAEYEYLWRFGYRSHPEHAPIREGWTSCGGSITSVSNPHIHPMGMLVNADLQALAEYTGDDYHRQRGEDGVAWLMQTLELYPEKTGYGRYGVLSERWCPSDGLLVELYSDGRPYSSWFSYNLWSAANALQCVCERLADDQQKD